MESKHEVSPSPYSLHFAQLQQEVLDAATACYECLNDAGIELTEGWLLEAYEQENDCRSFVSTFDALQHLYTAGKLKTFDRDSIIANMRGHNVFFALALTENEHAAYCFGSAALAEAGSQAAVRGLSAVVSAAKSYMFGLWLKSQSNDVH